MRHSASSCNKAALAEASIFYPDGWCAVGCLQSLQDGVELLSHYRTLWLVATLVPVLLFVGTLVIIPIVCLKVPSDYFVREAAPRVRWKVVLRTIVASVMILAGVAMLVLPGQGLLTILVGVSLLDFPRKRLWQRRLLCQPSVLRALNGIRSRAGKEPFRL